MATLVSEQSLPANHRAEWASSTKGGTQLYQASPAALEENS